MISKSAIQKSKAYYSALGHIKWTLDHINNYRLKRVVKYLYGRSVLDVGCGKANFLQIIKSKYQVAGIEINKERATDCNQILGLDVVGVANLEKKLDFADSSYDTVVCLEVLEHLVDPGATLGEVTRVSKKRVIITIPLNQQIQYVLCMHCGKFTPTSDHLHSFNKENIMGIIPENARVIKIELCGNKILSSLPIFNKVVFKVPQCIISSLDMILNIIYPRAAWMIVVLDKHMSTD